MKKRMKHGNRKFSKSSFSRACLFLLPSLISVLVLFVMPYLDVIRRSFLDGTGQRFVGMENYKTVVENTAFRLAAGNTVLFLSACVPLLLFLSLFIAIYLQRNKTVGNWLKSVFLLPMAMPVASIVLLWNVFFTRNGFLSHFLYWFGVTGQNWLNTKYSFGKIWGMISFSGWRHLPRSLRRFMRLPEWTEPAKVSVFSVSPCQISGHRYF